MPSGKRAAPISFLQRVDASLGIDPHVHLACIDGVYAERPDGTLEFHDAGPPSSADVETVAVLLHRSIRRLFLRRGLITKEGELAPRDSQVTTALERPTRPQLATSSPRAPSMRTASPCSTVPSRVQRSSVRASSMSMASMFMPTCASRPPTTRAATASCATPQGGCSASLRGALRPPSSPTTRSGPRSSSGWGGHQRRSRSGASWRGRRSRA